MHFPVQSVAQNHVAQSGLSEMLVQQAVCQHNWGKFEAMSQKGGHMEFITELTIKLLLLFFPGIICYLIIQALTVRRERKGYEVFLLTFVYGAICYLIFAVCVSVANTSLNQEQGLRISTSGLRRKPCGRRPDRPPHRVSRHARRTTGLVGCILAAALRKHGPNARTGHRDAANTTWRAMARSDAGSG